MSTTLDRRLSALEATQQAKYGAPFVFRRIVSPGRLNQPAAVVRYGEFEVARHAEEAEEAFLERARGEVLGRAVKGNRMPVLILDEIDARAWRDERGI